MASPVSAPRPKWSRVAVLGSSILGDALASPEVLDHRDLAVSLSSPGTGWRARRRRTAATVPPARARLLRAKRAFRCNSHVTAVLIKHAEPSTGQVIIRENTPTAPTLPLTSIPSRSSSGGTRSGHAQTSVGRSQRRVHRIWTWLHLAAPWSWSFCLRWTTLVLDSSGTCRRRTPQCLLLAQLRCHW